MKFLKEVYDAIEPQVLLEATSGEKQYTIEGIFLQAEVRNRNGRLYPSATMAREVERYNKELVSQNRALGELGHPDDPHIHLERVSHLITSLKSTDGKNWIGTAKIMDTPNGRIVKAMIDEKVKFGVSSRGVGSLRPSADGNVVGEDFFLATAGDIVADPSAPDAFVRGMNEQKEWVWNNGILMESTVNSIREQLRHAPRKKVGLKKIAEEVAFKQFLDAISVETQGRKNR
jgi:hypothetical protein